MSYSTSSNDNIQRQQIQARELEKLSTTLINNGLYVVKKNPVPVGLYLIGILTCLFFSGIPPTIEQEAMYNSAMKNIDHRSIGIAARRLDETEYLYNVVWSGLRYDLSFNGAICTKVYQVHDIRKSKGWFTCNTDCQYKKTDYTAALAEYKFQRSEEEKIVADAKSSVGIFSSYGVSETRNLFWNRFAKGKQFAQKQTMWDVAFMSIGAIGKDEAFTSYLMRIGIQLVFNFTMGMFGAVISFMYFLYGLIKTYRSGLLHATVFFVLAAVASIAYVMTWMIGMYTAAAGTVFVASKVMNNLQIQNNPQYNNNGRRME